MDQDVAADNSVERCGVGIVFHCALSEADIAMSRLADALLRKRNGLRAMVDADDAAAGSYYVGEQHSNIANAAAEIEHPHAETDPCVVQ